MAFRYLYYWHLNFILDGFRLPNGLKIGDTNALELKQETLMKLGDILVHMMSDIVESMEKIEVDYLLVMVKGLVAGGRETLLELTSHRDYW